MERPGSWARTGSTCATARAPPARTTTDHDHHADGAAVGEVVLVRARSTRTSVAGYAYPVIIEDAKCLE